MAERSYTILRWLFFGASVFIYLAALVFAYVGSEGLYGMTADPFAGLPLIFLGLPWSLVSAVSAFLDLPVWIGQIWVALCPVVNLYILWRLLMGRRDKA